MVASAIADEFLLQIQKEIDIAARPPVVFEAILEQSGPGMDMPDRTAMAMVLEPWPGGRWYRDLGHNAGHFWGHVQVIKPPLLLEITGPMFMSYPVVSHVQYRLTPQGSGTRLVLLHRAMGTISPEHRAGVNKGWDHIMAGIRARAIR